MAYCSVCGFDAKDQHYCTNCGSIIQNVKYDKTSPEIEVGNSVIVGLRNAYNYFNGMLAEYEEYDDIYYKIKRLENRKNPGLVWAIILSLIELSCVGYLIYIVVGGVRYSDGAVAIMFIGPPLMLIVILTVIIIVILAHNSSNNKKNNNDINRLYRKRVDIENILMDYYAQYSDCIIPMEYTNPHVIKQLLSASKNCETIDSFDIVLDERLKMTGKTITDVEYSLYEEGNGKHSALFVSSTFFE